MLRHDLSQGLRVFAGSDADRLRRMVALLGERIGEPKSWPRDPDAILALLDQLIQQILMEEDPAKQISLGVILEYAQYLVPSAELGQMAAAQGTRLVRLLSWAQNPYIKRHNIAFCLLCDQLAEINERLIGSAHVATLEVPMPDAPAREEFATWYDGQDGKPGNLTDFTPEATGRADQRAEPGEPRAAAGAGRQSGEKLDGQGLKRLKKGLIERQARGLVEFVEPPHSLDDFVGNDAIKRRLTEDAALLAKGRLDAAPMGYLICGPVGTGKTYLAECFAGSVGIPCVKLRNFRSKYVGETEGNLEQILTVLRAMGPVVVVIDEADAALGNREAGGDSGTSSRVFSMIAGQMGDTRYRGKLIWMLLTSRPDLLPIDLKRQGRAEVHLPLFSPRGRRRDPIHDPGDGPEEQDEPGRGRPARGPGRPRLSAGPTSRASCWRPSGRRSPRAASRSRGRTSPVPSTISSRRRRGWRKRSRSWRPCSSARRCRSCRKNGGRASPSPTGGPSSRSGWPRSVG